MDAIDRKILAVVQEDASLSVAETGQRVGLSSTPCWKRLQRLEADALAGFGDRERGVLLHHGEDLAVDGVYSLFPSKLGTVGLKQRHKLEYNSYFSLPYVFIEKNILFQA